MKNNTFKNKDYKTFPDIEELTGKYVVWSFIPYENWIPSGFNTLKEARRYVAHSNDKAFITSSMRCVLIKATK